MHKLTRRLALPGGLFLLISFLLSPAASGLPTPAEFVKNLDLRCYRIFNQPPLNLTLQLDHLNPVFVKKQLPTQTVVLNAPQDLCVPVYKENAVPPSTVLPYIQFVDWQCYRIGGPSLDIVLQLDHLNPVISQLLGPSDTVIVREPQQLCVPVYKDTVAPPPAIEELVSQLDLECYRVESTLNTDNKKVLLTHLNPLFSALPSESVSFVHTPNPQRLCVPVMKNQQSPPPSVLPIVKYSDVLCYRILGQPLNQSVTLTHLNPVLQGLPPTNVFVSDTDTLCVPVAKNSDFPPN